MLTCYRQGLRTLLCKCAGAAVAVGAAERCGDEVLADLQQHSGKTDLSIVHDVEHVEVQVRVALGSSGYTVMRHVDATHIAAMLCPARWVMARALHFRNERSGRR